MICLSSARKEMILGLFLAGYGHHVASWRKKDTNRKGPMDFEHLIHISKLAEKAKFDLVFLADSLFISNKSHPNILSRFEPMTLLSVLSTHTKDIGLAATASTTYSQPFHTARVFSSLDHLSNGRAAWNIVTSSIEQTAQNFNGKRHMEHELRYERAEEFVEVTKQLWDSWNGNALIRNRDTGEFIDKDAFETINHQGKHFSVKGPLNISKSPQGYPLLIQAGSSPTGTSLASKVADVVFTAQSQLNDAKIFYKTLKDKVIAAGRKPEETLITPGIFPVLGSTQEEAEENYAELQSLILPEVGLPILAEYIKHDLNNIPLDTKFTDIDFEHTEDGVKSRFEVIYSDAKVNDLTLEEVYKKVAGSRGHNIFVGTPEALADEMERWFTEDGCDGFNIMPPSLPDQFEMFTSEVIPILQMRKLYKKDYKTGTLREKIGLQNK